MVQGEVLMPKKSQKRMLDLKSRQQGLARRLQMKGQQVPVRQAKMNQIGREQKIHQPAPEQVSSTKTNQIERPHWQEPEWVSKRTMTQIETWAYFQS